MTRPYFKKLSYKNNERGILPLVTVIALIIILFITALLIRNGRFKKKDPYISIMEKRYEHKSEYVKRLNHINSTFTHDNKYMTGNNYEEKGSYKWTDMSKVSLNNKISMELADYFNENKIDSDKISIYVISLKGGDQFKLNEEKIFYYDNLDKLLINMVIKRLENNKGIDLEERIELKETDLVGTSLFFTKSSIGVSYPIKELMKISFKNNDKTASNILKRYLKKKQGISFEDLITREYSLGIEDNRNNSEEMIKLARELYDNKFIYQDIFTQIGEKKSESYFQNYILKDSKYNYLNVKDQNYYEFGYIEGINEYLYSINTQDTSEKVIRDIGEIIDRNISDYYLRKEI